MKATERSVRRLTSVSCVLGLVGVLLMAWSLVDPRPVPIVFSMTIGQIVGTLSLFLYVTAVFIELRRVRLLHDERAAPR